MSKDILVFYPDIILHKTSNEHHIKQYKCIKEKYEIKSLEWFIFHLFDSRVKVLYLNWIENMFGPNIMIFQKLQYAIKRGILKIAQKQNVKIVTAFHNKTPHLVNYDSTFYRQIVKPFMTYVFNVSDRIVVLSNGSTEYLKKEFLVNDVEKKVYFVPHCSYTKYQVDKCLYRDKYGISQNELLITSVGQISKYKNLDIAISAFVKSHINAKLLIAGKCTDQEYEIKLKDLISESNNIISSFGFVDDEEMSGIIQMSDAVILPYDNNSLNSGVMINVFSNGTTVIGNAIEMMRDFPYDLLYSYNYRTEDEHLERLTESFIRIEQDYLEGVLENKGKLLENYVGKHNSWNEEKEALIRVVSF